MDQPDKEFECAHADAIIKLIMSGLKQPPDSEEQKWAQWAAGQPFGVVAKTLYKSN
jgi:hypothetical protein